jgi:putative FmdB family regulatory protein
VPIYEYRCDDCGTSFEVLQRMSDDPLVTCEQCGGHLSKVLHPVAIHFKGSGFYTTDYGKGSGRPVGNASSEGSSSKDDKSAAGSESSGSGGDGAKGDAKAASKGDKAKEKQKAS